MAKDGIKVVDAILQPLSTHPQKLLSLPPNLQDLSVPLSPGPRGGHLAEPGWLSLCAAAMPKRDCPTPLLSKEHP